MVKTTKQMGRPTTRIDAAALARMRKDQGYSQLALAKAVYARAQKSWTSKKSLNTTAQRWESKGNISGSLLVHLAAVLKTSVEVLMGRQPVHAPCRREEIEALLKSRAADESNVLLQGRLSELRPYQFDNPCKILADEVTRDIEVAQLSQSPEAFEQLTAITGLDMGDLMRPLSHQGLWLLVGSGPGGTARQELLHGFNALQHAIREEWTAQSQQFPKHDSEIKFTEEKPWFKASWTQFGREELGRTLRFVRCQATARGLTWVTPSAVDRWRLDELRLVSYRNFSTVNWFGAAPVPSSVSRLRLVITKRLSLSETAVTTGEPEWEVVGQHAGSLLEMPLMHAAQHAEAGQAHYFSIHALSRQLWKYLEPHLREFPLRYWSLREGQSRIDILLEPLVPLRHWRSPTEMPQFGVRYSLELVELLPEGGCRAAPWKPAALKLIYSELEKDWNAARSVAEASVSTA